MLWVNASGSSEGIQSFVIVFHFIVLMTQECVGVGKARGDLGRGCVCECVEWSGCTEDHMTSH